MDHLDALHQQLSKVNVSDDTIARGVRLTATGKQKLARKFGVSEDELTKMLSDLASKLKDETAPTGLPASPAICEDEGDRFEYEADTLGNVNLTDTKTGATLFLQGSDGAKFLHELDRIGLDYQGLIAPYFAQNLREFVEPQTSDTGDSGGTYNFPYEGNFACARFWLAGNSPKIEIVSVVDADGHEVPLDAAQKAEAERTAWEWVNKV